MNLEKLLAANMIRFGVKNLNEQLQKTLLNEGLKPGDQADSTITKAENSPSGEFEAELKNKLQAYSTGVLQTGAVTAVAVGLYNLIKKNKKLQKLMTGYTVNQIFNMLTGGGAPTGAGPMLLPLIETAGSIGYEKTEVSVYPSIIPGNENSVATMGRINYFNNIMNITDTNRQFDSLYSYLILYLNAFNVENVLSGDFTQYRLSDMVDQTNHVNLLKAGPAVNTVIVYTKTSKVPGQADKLISTQNVGAIAPIPKVYDVNFAQSVATVPPNDAEVARAIKDAIAMFPDGNISNLSVVSSASPEYGAIKNVPGWEKSYPKGVTGTGNPGTGTDDASKNIQLAYDRGVNFVAAINAGLVAQGKPEMVNTSINWQISDTGGSPKSLGRFSNVNWATAATPGKDVNNMQNTGKAGDVISGKETFTIFQHVFTCVS